MRQNFVGMVVSNAMQKTVKVKVTSTKLHPIVLKVKIRIVHHPPGFKSQHIDE
jgi:ribosomal protein S17